MVFGPYCIFVSMGSFGLIYMLKFSFDTGLIKWYEFWRFGLKKNISNIIDLKWCFTVHMLIKYIIIHKFQKKFYYFFTSHLNLQIKIILFKFLYPNMLLLAFCGHCMTSNFICVHYVWIQKKKKKISRILMNIPDKFSRITILMNISKISH